MRPQGPGGRAGGAPHDRAAPHQPRRRESGHSRQERGSTSGLRPWPRLPTTDELPNLSETLVISCKMEGTAVPVLGLPRESPEDLAQTEVCTPYTWCYTHGDSQCRTTHGEGEGPRMGRRQGAVLGDQSWLTEGALSTVSEETGSGCGTPARLQCDEPMSGRADQAGSGEGGGRSGHPGKTGLRRGAGGKRPPESRNGTKGRNEDNIKTNKKVWRQAVKNNTFRIK